MDKKLLKNILIPAITLTLICVISAAGLALTDSITREKIAEIELKAQQESMERILPADSYVQGKTVLDFAEYEYFTAKTGDETVGYLFAVSNFGYGGQVKVMTGINTKGEVVAIEVLSASDETPGLGADSMKESFWEQFKGKKGELTVSKHASKNNEIQALTGATITTKSVATSVNTALKLYDLVKEGK